MTSEHSATLATPSTRPPLFHKLYRFSGAFFEVSRVSSGSIIAKAVAEQASLDSPVEMPPGILRFELEFRTDPNLSNASAGLRAALGQGHFELFGLHPDLAEILVLQFPDVRRSVSRKGQFELAAALVQCLDLRSCRPDWAANFAVEASPEERSDSAANGTVLARTCWSDADTSLQPDWILAFLDVARAWEMTRGKGVLIAQPDTGIAPHDAVTPFVKLDRSFDAFTGEMGTAVDPLHTGTGYLSHGTATASVVACGDASLVRGVAPEAALVPIRCVDNVALGLDGLVVARAILYARSIKADVISLSLGGLFVSRSIQRALQLAAADGMIIVAAAGNCVGAVVYPACDANAVAIAGVGQQGRAWKGTSRGAVVAAAAPSENVTAARRQSGHEGQRQVLSSQGTSFGAALTAGVAALWLAHHGRVAVELRASELGITVNDLFRLALQQTARVPDPSVAWDTGLGAGIVDAGALLDRPLHAITAGSDRPVAVALPVALEAHAEIAQRALEGVVADGFDWRRHGAEAVYLSSESLARTIPALARLAESAATPLPSATFNAQTLPPILQRVVDRLQTAPAVNVTTPWRGRARDGSVFGDLRKGGLETLQALRKRKGAVASEMARAGGIERLAERGDRIVGRLNNRDGDQQAKLCRDEAVRAGQDAIALIKKVADPAALSADMVFGLEALVRLTGRPALKLHKHGLSEDDPMFADGAWGPVLARLPFLEAVSRATGRINLGAKHQGTGFVIAAGLIMTNRHVLEAIGEEIQTSRGSNWIFPYEQPTIDFSDTGDQGPAFEITGVAFAGPHPTRGQVAFRNLDLAVLRCEANGSFPEPLTLRTNRRPPANGVDLLVVGYPAAPDPSALVDPATGRVSRPVSERLNAIFGVDYGRKYICPGRYTTATGGLGPRDPAGWVFAHDATTCGGNSGSLVIPLKEDGSVAGLHFAGTVLAGNYAHDLTRVGLPAQLGGH